MNHNLHLILYCFFLINHTCFSAHRPHIPVSKLVVSESYDTYISRSYQVTKEIISECKGKGKCYRGSEKQDRRSGV